MSELWKNVSASFEDRARDLVSRMTLEEKVSQMSYFSSALSSLGIPEYNWWNECLHGVARAGTATVFPQSIGMGASFDAPLLNEIAGVISDEARVKHHAAAAEGDRGIYKGLTMWSPNINIFRDPRWGRGHETYGEDPYLTARMGVAFIKGLQGEDKKYLKCAATAKHFAVHSGPEELRHHFDAVATPKDMAETYLPAFKAAVEEAGVESVMGAYNRVNGEAACASIELLQKKLREEWGFDGCVVSDCGAIEDICDHHKLTSDMPGAAALAVNNGCDLCCGQAFPHLLEAVRRGLIDEERISESVYHLMLTRMRLGMFDPEENQPYANLPWTLNDSPEHHALSQRMAEESLVLLKNDGLLPISRSIHTIAVIGPNADSRTALRGNYFGTASETHTILEGLREIAGPDVRLIYAEGCSLTGGSVEEAWGETADYRIAEAISAARRADLTLLVTGLNGDKEGEEGYGSGDRTTMNLPESQLALIEALATLDKPMALINMTGSATLFPHADRFGAILQAWYPGQMGGLAVARALYGLVSPSGRLPVTFYRDLDQVPPFEDYSMKGRTYRFMNDAPAYPFGYGLSYVRFAYDQLDCPATADPRQPLNVRVRVRNCGDMRAREVAQLYVRMDAPDAPIHQLAAFASVELAPGEAREVTLCVQPEQLCVYAPDGQAVPCEGQLQIFVGGGQPDARTRALTGIDPLHACVLMQI